ncbi:energy-coupling factor transporter transmembrane component T family protein [Brassicibacter mesophilus]|jgi:energy-coupling factor transport system permease protein|uniref:energy-coupling factor transporter transmembrane component T family protein n=1 Tax=Brassicibacter mesophilus TaxID=745119 RepID=UPI003D1C7EFD
MDMFLYLDKDTFLHRLDPRTKLLIMFGSFTVALMFYSLPILIGLSLVILLYGYSGKVLSNLKRIRVILFMIALVSIILWSLTKGGDTKLLGPITKEGIIYGITIGLKFDIMIIAGMIFLSATKIEEIAIGLVKLKVPYRGAFAFSTAIRLVPMIVGTSYTITQAQKSRGLDLDSGSFIQKAKKYVPLLIPTLISVIRGTNVFAMALESKGFGYDDERTNYLEINFNSRDHALMILTVVIIAVSIYAKVKFNL